MSLLILSLLISINFLLIFFQSVGQVGGTPCVMMVCIGLTDENVSVMIVVHPLHYATNYTTDKQMACQAVDSERAHMSNRPAFAASCLRRGSLRPRIRSLRRLVEAAGVEPASAVESLKYLRVCSAIKSRHGNHGQTRCHRRQSQHCFAGRA